MYNHHFRLYVLALCLAISSPITLGQPTESPPGTDPGDATLEFNRAVYAFLEGGAELETAAEIFERVRGMESGAEYQTACRYYLGLIALTHGVEHSQQARTAKDDAVNLDTQSRETAESQQAAELKERGAQRLADAEALANTALDDFQRAREHFQVVKDYVAERDPKSTMVRAALLLGIAQLAANFSPGEKDAIDFARQAEETLRQYIETEVGKNDREGHFYLAVALYRLTDEYAQARDSINHAASLKAAFDSLDKSERLADVDYSSGVLSAEKHERFTKTAAYYRALLEIQARRYQEAAQLLEQRFPRGPDQPQELFEKNAWEIQKKLEDIQITAPEPIRLPVPPPVGPLEFEGRVRVGGWYDSNVILLGQDTHLPLGFKQSADYQLGVTADFTLSRYITRTEAPWVGESLTVGIGGGTSNVWQPNIPEFDINRYPGRAYVNWQPFRDLYFGFQYEYSYTQLGHEPFIVSNRFTPVISKTWRTGRDDHEWGRTDLYFSQDDRNYLDILPDRRLNRDGVYRAAGVQQTFNLARAADLFYLRDYFATHENERLYFGDDWLQFYAGYEFRDEQTVGTEFDLRGHVLVWGLLVPLPYRLAFEVQGEFAWADYCSASIFDYERKPRTDFIQQYDFGLTYTFVARGEYAAMRTLDVKLRGGVSVTFQDSNIWNRLGEDIYEYDRGIYGMQLEVGF